MTRSFGVVLVSFLALFAPVFVSARTGARPAHVSAEAFLASNLRARGVHHTASGLQYRIVKSGSGARPTLSDVTLVNYVGKLTNGTVFDQSRQPTPLPVSGVVPGFAEALTLMPKGAKFRVWIKPSLGYGDTVSGPIPAHSVLVFDIEMLDFISQSALRELQARHADDHAAQPAAQSAPLP